MFKPIYFVFSLFTIFSHADQPLSNGCPNQDMVGKWDIAVDWSCSGQDSDTGNFNLFPDGHATGGMKGNDGRIGTWGCTSGLKLVVQIDDMTFTSYTFSSASMSGLVKTPSQEGCWVASHDLATQPPINPRDLFRRETPAQPPAIFNPPPQANGSQH